MQIRWEGVRRGSEMSCSNSLLFSAHEATPVCSSSKASLPSPTAKKGFYQSLEAEIIQPSQ